MESSLTRALAAMRQATRLPVAFGGAVTAPGSFTIAQTSGADTTALRGLVIRSGHGLGGRVLAEARIATVTDYLSDARITHQYDPAVSAEGLRSIVGVPVVADGRVRAVLYGASRTSTGFGQAVVDAMRETARHVAFEVAVAEATERRMRSLETTALLRAVDQAPTAPEWEEVRLAHAELRALARGIQDDALRDRLDAIVARLAGGGVPGAVRLSGRETDVLALVAIGCTNIEIAERLGLERETVKGYLRGAMRKLGAHRRTEAVAQARRFGLLP
ncbi:LuxR C-terminal-related transcriptional regulator [Microbacterium luticocti]|uniref:LuxR C-terminal-related transcriptional regulator n=1 Tax=Microbacterium luticocti TaxID=451764 RepID=UPI0004099F12|nr:LuxR C-terminal-related transcriptional regulator [Microbacterium luticocti]